jgi:hypothetical protein
MIDSGQSLSLDSFELVWWTFCAGYSSMLFKLEYVECKAEAYSKRLEILLVEVPYMQGTEFIYT